MSVAVDKLQAGRVRKLLALGGCPVCSSGVRRWEDGTQPGDRNPDDVAMISFDCGAEFSCEGEGMRGRITSRIACSDPSAEAAARLSDEADEEHDEDVR